MSMVLRSSSEEIPHKKSPRKNAVNNAGELHVGDFVTYTDYGFRKISHPNQMPLGVAIEELDHQGKFLFWYSGCLDLDLIPAKKTGVGK